jgi:hypothetical protein
MVLRTLRQRHVELSLLTGKNYIEKMFSKKADVTVLGIYFHRLFHGHGKNLYLVHFLFKDAGGRLYDFRRWRPAAFFSRYLVSSTTGFQQLSDDFLIYDFNGSGCYAAFTKKEQPYPDGGLVLGF